MSNAELLHAVQERAAQMSQDEYDELIYQLAMGDYQKFVAALVHLEGGELRDEDYVAWFGSEEGLLAEGLTNNP